MKPTLLFRVAFLAATVAYLSGCATVGGPEPEPQTSGNPAVLALVDTAHSNLETGRFDAATASLERALRIEPKNPMLWQELAKAHLREGNYQQAENFAARSNSWAGASKPVLAANWRIISDARLKRGDETGARAALARAAEFE